MAVQCFIIFACLLFGLALSCGPITHIEISHRATEFYEDVHNGLNFGKIISAHKDALEAGSTFPDAFYPSTCFWGNYHDISEDTHWTPFLQASISYIQKMYPKPWGEHVQKLVAFLMGVVSHQVADVLWHSLGIDQGFIQTMSKMNFHNIYSDAHTAADIGGDILNLYQLDLNYSSAFMEWYVPVNDLEKIYEELYGTKRISTFTIAVCSRMNYLLKVVEKLGGALLYPIYAKESPFLVDQLYDYFQGGVIDMAAWTDKIWRDYAYALVNGQDACELPYNPVFIRCNKTNLSLTGRRNDTSLRNGFYTQMDFGDLGLDDVLEEEKDGGIVLSPGPRLRERMLSRGKDDNTLLFKSELNEQGQAKAYGNKDMYQETSPSGVITSKKAYAQLGSSLEVADLNNDGYDDLVVGSAGVYPSGVVYTLFGTHEGITNLNMDIEEAANMTLAMPVDDHSWHGQFGSAIAVFDLDQDGQQELAVGAPSYRSDDLLYQGRVYIFSLSAATKDFQLRATIDCLAPFCNLGYSLLAEDVNNDTHPDLVIGAPFSSAMGGEQRGVVTSMLSKSEYRGMDKIQLILQDLTSGSEFISLHGTGDYSWTGFSLSSGACGASKCFAFGEPGFSCESPGCEYNPDEKEMAGNVRAGTLGDGGFQPMLTVESDSVFNQLGSQVALGNADSSGGTFLATGASSATTTGKILFISTKIEQAGQVWLQDVDGHKLGQISGDTEYGRFGDTLKFADLTGDGLDDLIVGAPLRSTWWPDRVQEGKVYIYGGKSFPEGDISGDCGILSMELACPAKRAYKVLSFNENLARFGTEVAVVKGSSKTSLFVTAAHSSKGARLAGAIGVFDIAHQDH